MSIQSRVTITLLFAACYVWLLLIQMQNRYGDSPAAYGVALILAPSMLGAVIIACFRYKCSLPRYWSIVFLTLLGAFSNIFLIGAWITALWRFSLPKMSRRPCATDIPATVFAQAASELEQARADKDVLAKAIALSGGEKPKVIAEYTKIRAEELMENRRIEDLKRHIHEAEVHNSKRISLALNWLWWPLIPCIYLAKYTPYSEYVSAFQELIRTGYLSSIRSSPYSIRLAAELIVGVLPVLFYAIPFLIVIAVSLYAKKKNKWA